AGTAGQLPGRIVQPVAGAAAFHIVFRQRTARQSVGAAQYTASWLRCRPWPRIWLWSATPRPRHAAVANRRLPAWSRQHSRWRRRRSFAVPGHQLTVLRPYRFFELGLGGRQPSRQPERKDDREQLL